MNDGKHNLVDKHVSNSYIQQGKEARGSLEKSIRKLLQKGKIPSSGWSDLWIKHLLQEISLMDSNNFPDHCGFREREARIACQLVVERHFYLSHGIGRSGDIIKAQPKAAGSSLLAKLANSFALDIIKMRGVESATTCLLIPVATGMAFVLTLLTLRVSRPKAKYVIWPRVDQKCCFQSILTSGMEPLIIENVLLGDHLETDIEKIRTAISKFGSETILCVLTSSSCLAPRVPDKLEDVALICKEKGIPHVVNNAYGIQSTACMQLIQNAARIGRVDTFIQATNKNFLVPVGGTIIAGFDQLLIQSIGKMYPGRASISPILDFCITMLSLGESGYNGLLEERKQLYNWLRSGLDDVGGRYGERCMDTQQNEISLALTLSRLDVVIGGEKSSVSEFGAQLFKHPVSGIKLVTPTDTKSIGKYTFEGWGAHHKTYPTSYLTIAASVGRSKTEMTELLKRLDKALFVKLFVGQPPVSQSTESDADVATLSSSPLNRSHHSRHPLRPSRSLKEEARPGSRRTKSDSEEAGSANNLDGQSRPAKELSGIPRPGDRPVFQPTKSLTERTREAGRPQLRRTKSVADEDEVVKAVDVPATNSMSEQAKDFLPKKLLGKTRAEASSILQRSKSVPEETYAQTKKASSEKARANKSDLRSTNLATETSVTVHNNHVSRPAKSVTQETRTPVSRPAKSTTEETRVAGRPYLQQTKKAVSERSRPVDSVDFQPTTSLTAKTTGKDVSAKKPELEHSLTLPERKRTKESPVFRPVKSVSETEKSRTGKPDLRPTKTGQETHRIVYNPDSIQTTEPQTAQGLSQVVYLSKKSDVARSQSRPDVHDVRQQKRTVSKPDFGQSKSMTEETRRVNKPDMRHSKSTTKETRTAKGNYMTHLDSSSSYESLSNERRVISDNEALRMLHANGFYARDSSLDSSLSRDSSRSFESSQSHDARNTDHLTHTQKFAKRRSLPPDKLLKVTEL